MTTPLVHIAPATLLALRATMLTRADLDTVFALRDAGYAGGESVFQAFQAYVRSHNQTDVEELGVDEFFQRAGAFFTESGWGQTTFSVQDDTFCVVEIDQCWEADMEHQPEPRGCHLTVGLLGAFLGKLADYPVGVLQVEGPITGNDRCRFLAGNMTMIADYYAKHS